MALVGATILVPVMRERAALSRAAAMPDPWAATRPLSRDGTRHIEIDDGVVLRVAERGSGRAVVFFPGWGLTLDTWSYLPRLLPGDVRLVAVDLRGHGGSSPVPPGGNLDLLARDIARLLEVLEITDAILVGHSFGGIVLQAFAVAHPDAMAQRVRGLLLVSTMARGVADIRTRLLARVLSSPGFTRLASSPRLSLMLARHSFASDVPASRLELTRDAGDLGQGRREFNLAKLGDLSAKLRSIQAPVTVLSGVEDPLTPVKDAVLLAEAIPGARLRLLVDTGHLLPLESPKAVAEEVGRLLTLDGYGGATFRNDVPSRNAAPGPAWRQRGLGRRSRPRAGPS
jgi:pimeloyl-ACP methyl ester carboxylesterase